MLGNLGSHWKLSDIKQEEEKEAKTDLQTIVAASTVEKDIKENYGGNIEAAKAVGEAIAKKALEKGIKEVVFDRGGFIYHGKVQALADAAREAGLEF